MRGYTTVYILLLLYVIAALVFWGFSLERQSGQIFAQQKELLALKNDSILQPALFLEKLAALQDKKEARTKQYVGEGGTFLLIILIGAAVVLASFRRSYRLSRQQNNFMLAVTHELKSPIAAMKLNMQTLRRPQLTEEQRNMLLQRAVVEADRLNDLCNNMLIASQMEGRQYKPSMEWMDYSGQIEDIANAYAQRYIGRFAINVEDDIGVRGDGWLLQIAIHNLIENALKYAPADTQVSIVLANETHTGKALLRIIDEGPGVPDTEKQKIFTKFYRVGDENTRSTKGTGLGLYLAARIVREHKGHICVKDNHPKGAIFELELPVA